MDRGLFNEGTLGHPADWPLLNGCVGYSMFTVEIDQPLPVQPKNVASLA
jgi:hypothetical protein